MKLVTLIWREYMCKLHFIAFGPEKNGQKFAPFSSFLVIICKLLDAFTSNVLTLYKIYFYTFSENFIFCKQWYKVQISHLLKALLGKNFKI